MRLHLKSSGPWIGLGGMFVVLFLYGWSALALPGWLTSLLLPLVWLALFVLATRWFLTHPYRVLSLPVVAVVLWYVGVLAGA